MKFTRITVYSQHMGGAPCLLGLRIPVATVVAMIADGMTEAEIVAAYPGLQREDMREALRYAAEAVLERELPLVGTSAQARDFRIDNALSPVVAERLDDAVTTLCGSATKGLRTAADEAFFAPTGRIATWCRPTPILPLCYGPRGDRR